MSYLCDGVGNETNNVVVVMRIVVLRMWRPRMTHFWDMPMGVRRRTLLMPLKRQLLAQYAFEGDHNFAASSY